MNKIMGGQIMKKAENIVLWKNRFTDRKASGLKVEEWCEKNNVSRHAYYYWYRKVQAVPQHASEKSLLRYLLRHLKGKETQNKKAL